MSMINAADTSKHGIIDPKTGRIFDFRCDYVGPEGEVCDEMSIITIGDLYYCKEHGLKEIEHGQEIINAYTLQQLEL